MKITCLPVIVQLCLLFSAPIVCADLPILNVSVDGNPSEWSGIEPVWTDAQGDSQSPGHSGTDMYQFFIAANEGKDTLYFRLDVVGAVNTEQCPVCSDPDAGLLEYLIAFDDPQFTPANTWYEWQIGFDMKGFWIWDFTNGFNYDDHSNLTYYSLGETTSSIAKGSVIEMSMPISYINNTIPVKIAPYLVLDDGNNTNADHAPGWVLIGEGDPLRPELVSPTNGASDLSLTPTLTTTAFSDPDTGNTHAKTDWQISTATSFSSTILSMQSKVHLTSLTVPDLTLEQNTTYYWRVRFYDNNSDASAWSQTFSFTTGQTFTDINVNGIPDALENPTVDLDNDGTADIQQTTIKSLNTVIGNGQMGVSINSLPSASARVYSDPPEAIETITSEDAASSISIVRIDSIDPDTISEVATPSYMPLGLFSFKLTVADPGDEANVTVYFSEQAPATAKWLFYDSINGWSDYSEHATFSQDRMSVALELKDGGHGDSDGIANGVIVDPCGWGMASWLKGQVTDASTQRAVTNCSLIISELDLTIPTLSDGHFLSMILPGTYDILVSAPGYQSRTLSDVDIDEAEIVTRNISMSGNTGVKNVSITGTPTIGNQMTFSVENNSSDTTYYRFSMHPDYGTCDYEKGFWQSMTDTEYISQNSCNYSFNQSGKYIVVVWLASSTNPVVSGIPMLGWSVDVSDASCKTNFTGLEISGTQKVNTPVSFTVNAENACSSHLYYRFSMHADYGTDAYNTGAWQQMTPTEWVADNSIDYTFTKAGKYIVVVWVSDTNQNVDPLGVPIIGWSVDIE